MPAQLLPVTVTWHDAESLPELFSRVNVYVPVSSLTGWWLFKIVCSSWLITSVCSVVLTTFSFMVHMMLGSGSPVNGTSNLKFCPTLTLMSLSACRTILGGTVAIKHSLCEQFYLRISPRGKIYI